MGWLWDWFDSWPPGALTFVSVVASVATGAAAVLAAVTIVQSKRASAKAQAALLHERRVDYQLEQLVSLLENLPKGSNVAFVDAAMETRARLLPPELIPLTRAAFNLSTTPTGQSRIEQHRIAMQGNRDRQSTKDSMRAQLRDELEAAIAIVLASEPPPLPSIRQVSKRRSPVE